MNCEKYKKLIEEYLDGMISEGQWADLKTHTETCEGCREELDRCKLMQEMVKQAFSSRTTAAEAKASVVARISAEPDRRLRRAGYGIGFLAGRRAAIAASILLAVGLTLGYGLGRASLEEPTGAPIAAEVAMRVVELDGTVLVRHQGSDVWRILEADSGVYVGDVFHSAAKSGFVLEMEDKSTIEVNQNSMLVLKSYNGETQFFLEHGECTAALESPHPPFFIGTPHGRVEALGTEFTVTVE
jgi:hypothetical protein